MHIRLEHRRRSDATAIAAYKQNFLLFVVVVNIFRMEFFFGGRLLRNAHTDRSGDCCNFYKKTPRLLYMWARGAQQWSEWTQKPSEVLWAPSELRDRVCSRALAALNGPWIYGTRIHRSGNAIRTLYISIAGSDLDDWRRTRREREGRYFADCFGGCSSNESSFNEYNAVSHPASTVAVSIPLRKKSADYVRPASTQRVVSLTFNGLLLIFWLVPRRPLWWLFTPKHIRDLFVENPSWN